MPCCNKTIATETNYHENQRQINLTTQSLLNYNLWNHFLSLRLKGPVIYKDPLKKPFTIPLLGFRVTKYRCFCFKIIILQSITNIQMCSSEYFSCKWWFMWKQNKTKQTLMATSVVLSVSQISSKWLFL